MLAYIMYIRIERDLKSFLPASLVFRYFDVYVRLSGNHFLHMRCSVQVPGVDTSSELEPEPKSTRYVGFVICLADAHTHRDTRQRRITPI